MKKVRIASAQFLLSMISTYDELEAQLVSIIEESKDKMADILVLPEYFSMNLVGLLDEDTEEKELFRLVADYTPRLVDLLSEQAKKRKLYIVAGSMPVVERDNQNKLFNDSYIFSPQGKTACQGKLHATTYERETVELSTRDKLLIIRTPFCKIAVNICYDIEFPEVARAATDSGARLILVPSWTDDYYGFTRVRICSQARCIENHIYVIQSAVVGSLMREPAPKPVFGQAGIFCPSDQYFPTNAILKEGHANQAEVIVAQLDLNLLEQVRAHGATTPVTDKEGIQSKLVKTELTEL